MTVVRLRPDAEAVTLDLDFTIWDLAGVIEHAEHRSHDWLRRAFPEVADTWSPEALRGLRERVVKEDPGIGHDVTAMRHRALEAAGRHCGLDGPALERMVAGAFHEFMEGRHEVVLYEDSLEFLDWLRGRYRLGAITNGNADIARVGLEGYFDFALSAVEIGAAKPSHLIFETAANRAGVAPEAVIHVGDDAHSDVYGAALFGMQAVWLNREGADWPEAVTPVPHVEVASLSELQRLLSELSDRR